jgi:hypothetical protein
MRKFITSKKVVISSAELFYRVDIQLGDFKTEVFFSDASFYYMGYCLGPICLVGRHISRSRYKVYVGIVLRLAKLHILLVGCGKAL